VIALGLALAAVSAVAINGGYRLQHTAASALPPLSLRRPLRSLSSLVGNRRWLLGFLGGIAGWVLYVAALKVAPLSIVQAASAGGIGVLALGSARLEAREQIGVGAALGGLLLLAASLGAHAETGHGVAPAVAAWLAASALTAAVVARALPGGAGLGTAAGVLYAAGDVATKAAVGGGARLWFVPALLACHGVAVSRRPASPCCGRTRCRSSPARSSSRSRCPAAGAAGLASRPSRSSWSAPWR
jgi:hypothetical protein